MRVDMNGQIGPVELSAKDMYPGNNIQCIKPYFGCLTIEGISVTKRCPLWSVRR